MRADGTKAVILAGLMIAGSSDPGAAQELPGLVGSWAATSFVLTTATEGPFDFIVLGGAAWLTLDPDSRFVLTQRDPGETTLEADTGWWTLLSAASFQLVPDDGEMLLATVTLTADTLVFAGEADVDLDGDGVEEPGTFEMTFQRDAPRTAEGDGIPGAWVRSQGRARTYRLHVPDSNRESEPAALLLAFHGLGSNGREMQHFSSLDRVADRHGFITVYPNGVGGSWAAGCDCSDADRQGVDDLLFVQTLIGQLSSELSIDPGRLYAAGFSLGAMFSQRLACDLADRVAAVASVAAGMTSPLSSRCSPARPTPIVFFHGTSDGSVPWAGSNLFLSARATLDRWAELNRCVGKAVEPLLDTADDGTTVTKESFASCAANAETILYGVEGGGHTWPGSGVPWPQSLGAVTQDISASELIGDFFTLHRR